LAEKKHPLAFIFFQCLVADLDGVFNSIAEAKMPCDVKFNRSEVKYGRLKILLAKILDSAKFFDFSCDGRPIVSWDVELFDGRMI
jgi:hypothetical protein